MGDNSINDVPETLSRLEIPAFMHPLMGNNDSTEFEPAEDMASDSEDYLSESLWDRNFQSSTQSNNSITLAQIMTISDQNENVYGHNRNVNCHNIQIPIVGYEIMEERARFTVYKLRIENKVTVIRHLPKKRWLKNNFDPIFLEERGNGLQTLVNAILSTPDLVATQEIQDFFCLNEPPAFTEANEESRAIFETLEETISDLKQQLREKESLIESLQTNLHSSVIENDHLKKLIR
ncbi:hypothetical protein NQ314_015912 [Rhamnusium bicolor]|uniref:PX domain-containing protein n=1 Tax=Rhamnusium bicolor TaxID=1586634 RepID=A0AAV8WYA0_9CUCU|nr:hypothetical protein NQ314_015912 [Rhamnusium bicolor]